MTTLYIHVTSVPTIGYRVSLVDECGKEKTRAFEGVSATGKRMAIEYLRRMGYEAYCDPAAAHTSGGAGNYFSRQATFDRYENRLLGR